MDLKVESKVNPRIQDLRTMFRLQPAEIKLIVESLDVEFTAQRKRTFATEGGAAGERWAALSPAYKKAKDRKYPGRKIMQRTGKMRSQFVNRNAPEHVARSAKTQKGPVVYLGAQGKNARVAAYHIHDVPNPLANPRLPNRNVMAHSDAQYRKLLSLVSDFFTEVKIPRVERVLARAAEEVRRRMAARGGR